MIVKCEYDKQRPNWKPNQYFDPTRWDALQSGEKLTMADGSVWFHPYSGGQPWKVK